MAQRKERTINLDELSRNIGKGIETVDDRRADALERLQIVRGVKASSMRREQERLTLKYGEGHPRVQTLTNRIAINEGLLANLEAEAARARTPIPTPDQDHWILHGYVRDEDRKGVQGLSVALYDQSNEWVRELGYGCTDQNGYFKIDSASSLIDKGVQVSVNVLSGDGEVLYADEKTLLTPAPGQVDYREILLTEGAEVCRPPSGGKEPPRSPDSWTVRGRVTDHGKGVGGLIVNVFDKDLIFDDQLGQTETDASGAYGLTYRTSDFRDLIERKPDIYLKVTDQKGKTLYSTKDAIRYEAGRVEVINIEIAAPKRK